MARVRLESDLVVGRDQDAGRRLIANPAGFCGAISHAAMVPYVLKRHRDVLRYLCFSAGILLGRDKQALLSE